MNLPNIPLPKQAREEQVKKAVWDYLRASGLSFDQANQVKPQALSLVFTGLDKIVQDKKDEPSE